MERRKRSTRRARSDSSLSRIFQGVRIFMFCYGVHGAGRLWFLVIKRRLREAIDRVAMYRASKGRSNANVQNPSS